MLSVSRMIEVDFLDKIHTLEVNFFLRTDEVSV